MEHTAPYFELLVNILSGSSSGGGLKSQIYVETFYNDKLIDTSEVTVAGTPINRKILKSLPADVGAITDSVLSFSMYKKRWTSDGYKLVGTLDISLSNYIPLLNKESNAREHSLISARKNVTLTGVLTLRISLNEIETLSSKSPQKLLTAKGALKENIDACRNVDDLDLKISIPPFSEVGMHILCSFNKSNPWRMEQLRLAFHVSNLKWKHIKINDFDMYEQLTKNVKSSLPFFSDGGLFLSIGGKIVSCEWQTILQYISSIVSVDSMHAPEKILTMVSLFK